MSNKYKNLITDVNNRVGSIIFNRPEYANAFDDAEWDEFVEEINTMDCDRSVGAIVLKGVGKHFNAGGDIQRFRKELDTGKNPANINEILRTGRTALSIKKCSKPAIAMINGAAAGAGAAIALACDFRFMTPKSFIAMSFINLSFPGDTGAAYFLYKLCGMGHANELMMTGRKMYGEEAGKNNIAFLTDDNNFEKATNE